jgi:acyl carrier protein
MTADNKRLAIVDVLLEYILEKYPSDYTKDSLPRDESLVELGIIDSYGIVELIVFLETKWEITIADEEITRENLGSINRMTTFLLSRSVVCP